MNSADPRREGWTQMEPCRLTEGRCKCIGARLVRVQSCDKCFPIDIFGEGDVLVDRFGPL